nr:ATP synthase F0 subunit 8 [Gongylus gongylodes]
MPQMMPLNWLMLFLFFSMMLILFNIMNYYMPFNKSFNKTKIKIFNKSMIWKW